MESDEINTLKEEINATNRITVETLKKLTRAKKERDLLKQETSELKKKLNSLENACDKRMTHDGVKEGENVMVQLEHQLNDALQESDQLKIQLKSANNRVDELEKNIGRLTNEVSEMKAKIRQLEQQLNDASHESDQLTIQLKYEKSRVKELEQSIGSEDLAESFITTEAEDNTSSSALTQSNAGEVGERNKPSILDDNSVSTLHALRTQCDELQRKYNDEKANNEHLQKSLQYVVATQASKEEMERVRKDLELEKKSNCQTKELVQKQQGELDAARNSLQQHIVVTQASKEELERVRKDLELEKKRNCQTKERVQKQQGELNADRDRMSEEVEHWRSRIKQLQQKLTDSTQKIEGLQSKLSQLMGSKLSDNNPDIADLSDKNRPTKLAEKYQELFDIEWTDAYEELENTGADDTRCIELLLELLKKVEDFCDELSKEQSTEIYKIVKMTQYKTTECPELSNEEKKQVKDFRKIFADVGVQEVQMRFTSDILKDSKFASIASKAKAKSFIKGCVELCWFMSVQDPPVVIGEFPKSGVAFDTNHFKAYTRTGPKLDYVVWPPLFLHKGGPLLEKGVAQGAGISARVRRRQDVHTNASADAKPSTQTVPGIDPLYDNARTPGSQSDQVDVNSSAQSEQWLNTNAWNIRTSTFYMPRNTSESSNQQRFAKSMSQSRPGQTSVNNFDSRSGEPTHVDTIAK